MPLRKEDAVFTLKDYEPQLWTCLNCYCGLCVEACPVYRELKNEVGSARGMVQVALALLAGEMELSDIIDDVAYACTGCGWCDWTCSLNRSDFIQTTGTKRTRVSGATMAEIFRSMKVENGQVPVQVMEALNNLVNVGNPYGRPKDIKDKWVKDLGLNKGKADTLLYVGATIPFEDRLTKMAEAVVNVLKATEVNIGMLGSDEMDSGSFAMMMGEEGLFLDMVEQNEKTIQACGFKQIICVSPHDYDVFKNYYSTLKGIDIKHYTQFFNELIKKGKIRLEKPINKKVTYHDPCYLGRRSDIYDEPREILQSIPGVELIEMEKNRENSFCCGGGGTGLFYDLPNINMNMARVEQAGETNAEILVVACPICLKMFDDAIKSMDLKMQVEDIAELMLESI